MDQSKPPANDDIPGLNEDEAKKAAELIQRTYRGHLTRQAIKGYGLDPTTKWMEVVRDAKYYETTTPSRPGAVSPAHERWKKVSQIARRAGADDSSDPDVSISEAFSSESDAERQRSRQQQAEREKRKAAAKQKRKNTAKMMDLQYFLEMVDHKHRYGSNLRKYHAYWKTQDTNQNFFYWLDEGEGKEVELDECSRARLDKEQVRYLSREERMNYLVKIDEDGKLRWAKNEEYVWTKDELYRDSVKGIVPTNDSAPAWKHNVKTEYHDDTSSSSDSSDSDEEEKRKQEQESGLEGERYINEDFHRAKGPAKLKHVSAAVLFNHMVRRSMKKGHKWIFVADVSFRLYVGYKQSGAFQHSSFLHGSRILAAGLIKIKDGRLHRLSPLSGHYRPPAANFRSFVHSLEEEGCDMSHVSISRSYAVLVGLEGYVKTRRKIKRAGKAVEHQIDKVVRPEKVKEEEEAAKDHSQSAQKEREYLENQRRQDLERRQSEKKSQRGLGKRLSHAWDRITGRSVDTDDRVVKEERGTPGTGPEDGVPPPDGHRRLESTK